MSGWCEKQVKELGKIVTGWTPSTKRKDFYDGDYNLISPADLDNGKYIRTAHRRLTKLGFQQCRALPKDTVLVGCIGNVGKLGMVGNERSATNQQINALICNTEHDSEFVYYCFCENRGMLAKLAVKTTVPILNKTNFAHFEVNVPPLPEQKKIAHILSTVQRAIEAQEQIIQTTTELFKTMLHQLMTAQIRVSNEDHIKGYFGEDRSMSDWRQVQIKDLGEIVTGRTPSTKRKDFYDGDYNLISPADLDNGKYISTAHKRLTKLGFEQCRALPQDTVIVGCIGNVGKLGMVDDDRSATNQQINAIICNEENDPEFVYYCFNKNRKKLESRAVKTTVPILNKTNFGNFEVSVPPLHEQKKIAHVLSTIQQKTDNAQSKKTKLQDLFRTLLHELMTAKIRVDKLETQL